MNKYYLFLILLALLLQSCMVGPNYEQPQTNLGDDWVGESYSQDYSEQDVDLSWWESLGDPQLTLYVNEAVSSNYDISIASARVREARALRGVSASAYYPQIDSDASYQRFRQSENGIIDIGTLSDLGFADDQGDLYQAGFDAFWEIDIFGGTRRSVEAANARVEAAVENRRDVLISVISEVARNYVELRGAQKGLTVSEKNIRIQTDTLNLVENKYKAGLSSELDVARARAQLESTRSTLPPIRASIRASAYRIAVLLGRRPGALLDELLKTKPIPSTPDIVPIGLPSDLLLRRADLRRVESELMAATADIGVATSDLFPKFFITGAAGLESVSFSDFFDASSGVWSIGPSVSWPIFQGGRIRSNIKVAEAVNDAELSRYQQTILLALEEVESSLVRYAEEELRRRSLNESAKSSQKAVNLAEVVYEKGLADFLTVLDAERTLTEVEDRLVRSETELVVNLIALYKALGGGWESFEEDNLAQK
ncbi:MAG: TolC family protein [Thermodesulfobacteriota bacterium]